MGRASFCRYGTARQRIRHLPRLGPCHFRQPCNRRPIAPGSTLVDQESARFFRNTLNKPLNASAFTPSFLRRQEPTTLWPEVPAFAGTSNVMDRRSCEGRNLKPYGPRFLPSQERRVGINTRVTDLFRDSLDYPGNTAHGEPALRQAQGERECT